jgi:glycosyltransferase involved in cell wall biosynthesis
VGGLERQLYYLLRSMDRERYQPAVVVWNFSEKDMYVPKIRALRVPLYSLPHVSSRTAKLAALKEIVRRLGPEVVHSYTFFTNFAAYWSTRRTSSVSVGSIRSSFQYAKQETGWLLGNLSVCFPRTQICNSFCAEQEMRGTRGIFVPAQLSVVTNGLDLDQFRYVPPGTHTIARIIGVGSLLPIKRWDRLIEAAHALKAQGLAFRIQIAGGGPLMGPLREQVQRLRLSESVELLGHRAEIPELVTGASFLVHTSDSEGCPNAVIEAMACGRAVVAHDVGDIPWLVEDGKTGFVVRRGDQTALVERIKTLVESPDLSLEMGKQGRAKAEVQFGLGRLVSQTLDAYRKAGWKEG